MEQIKIPGTDLTVTTVGLGSSHFGTETDSETSFRILDAWVENGGNLIDTAHVYGASRPEEESPSEKTIGDWMRTSGKRDQIVLCTKGGHPVIDPATRTFGTPRVNAETLQ
ncbi:MAG: aldo/keto reductase, partial [Lachnospiraceae bacterium]|nr:aldo/keto reductase [Lachnospiraceae bacterium]